MGGEITVKFRHRVEFTRGLFDPAHPLLREVLTESGAPARALVAIDAGVARANPQLPASVAAYFAAAPDLALAAAPLVIAGGEQAKNDPAALEALYAWIDRHRLCRHSVLVAIGGGAVLDLAGFAAATAHRGVRHVRVPTTTLGQSDAGVGVKNGVNFRGKKNFIGTFAVPVAVLNDLDLLDTQPEREKRAGLIEAVKVACIRDAAFFDWIEEGAGALAGCERGAVAELVRRCAALHVRHIIEGGDPFEFGSARPLDFGHWAAHKLEQASAFRLGHGAAVAAGIALDVLYSARTGLLDGGAARRILALLDALGFAPVEDTPLDDGWIEAGLEEFREHLGGALTITLLAAIGRGVEVHAIDTGAMHACWRDLAPARARDAKAGGLRKGGIARAHPSRLSSGDVPGAGDLRDGPAARAARDRRQWLVRPRTRRGAVLETIRPPRAR
jgi:3-dehydroquinate synthase